MKQNCDVLIVGAGTAGCLAAVTALKLGLTVSLIESKTQDEVGNKICGDAVGSHHFDRLGLSYPKGDELDCHIKGVEVHSPDKETCFRIVGKGVSGFIIDRKKFGQRLLNLCLDEGVKFHSETIVVNPLLKKDYVIGVAVLNKVKRVKEKLYAPITIDASGVPAVIRRNLPPSFGVERSLDQSEIMACYREIRKDCHLESPYCQIYLNHSIAPGGYYWIFPKGDEKVNTGLGIKIRNDGKTPKNLFQKVLSEKFFVGSKRLEGGGGFCPTRRPLNTLVANGVLFTGDSASLVNPIHGGGIGSSMLSGKLAAETAVEALEKGECSRETLWKYNIRYHTEYGAKQASLDVFRIFLQSSSNDELSYGMKYGLVKEEDVLKASLDGDLKLSITDKAERAIKGLRKMKFLMSLRDTAKKMKVMKRLYLNYPNPDRLPIWEKEINSLK